MSTFNTNINTNTTIAAAKAFVELKATVRAVGKFKVWYDSYIEEDFNLKAMMLSQLVDNFDAINASMKKLADKNFRASDSFVLVKYSSPYLPELVIEVHNATGFVKQEVLNFKVDEFEV